MHETIIVFANFCSVVLNGGIFTLSQALEYQKHTGVRGVMSARGLLKNPAMFAGYDTVPLKCVNRFVELSTEYGGALCFAAIHQHCMFMLHPPVLGHAVFAEFSGLTSVSAIWKFLEEREEERTIAFI